MKYLKPTVIASFMLKNITCLNDVRRIDDDIAVQPVGYERREK